MFLLEGSSERFRELVCFQTESRGILERFMFLNLFFKSKGPLAFVRQRLPSLPQLYGVADLLGV
jgi:hypothetical protein